MTKKELFKGWFDEATTGFANTEVDMHNFSSIAEYISAYFDGVDADNTVDFSEAERLAGLYEDYRQEVLKNGQYSVAYDRMIDAVKNE